LEAISWRPKVGGVGPDEGHKMGAAEDQREGFPGAAEPKRQRCRSRGGEELANRRLDSRQRSARNTGRSRPPVRRKRWQTTIGRRPDTPHLASSKYARIFKDSYVQRFRLITC
jgi:hypothetical protein